MARPRAEYLKEGFAFVTSNCGSATILKYNCGKDVIVRFENTGFIGSFYSDKVKDGQIKDPYSPRVYGVGYFGVGKYKARTKEYSVWNSMMCRCYSEKYHKIQPTYIGCTVSDEWHNFQVFAEWFHANYKDGMHLDKDIKVKGNKIYGYKYCKFVTQSENNTQSISHKYKVINPTGEVFIGVNIAKLCLENNLDRGAMSLVCRGKSKAHKGWTLFTNN